MSPCARQAPQTDAEGIRCNSAHPGPIMTPMSASNYADPEVAAQRLGLAPLGRRAYPIEVAYGALYLASDEASFVTGAELVSDGGCIAQ